MAAFFALRRWAFRKTDDRKLIGNLLQKGGLSAPLIAHIDSEDWRCALGEATTSTGARIRFNIAPQGGADALLIVTDLLGREEWRTFIKV